MPNYSWMDGACGSLPEILPMKAGRDKDGADMYIGRCWHEKDLIPAKVIPSKGGAFVAYCGAEHFKKEYEVMCEGRAAWQSASNGKLPPDAEAIGQTADGEKLYCGRVMHDGALTIGKVQPSRGLCFIPYNGEELAFNTYEVLILK